MKILIIDDHQLFLDGISLVVQRLQDGVQLLPEADPLKAMRLLETNADIELVLLDINMPRMNGIAFMAGLQEQNYTTPVVVVSATESVDDVVKVLEAGAVGFIPKSHGAEAMLSALQQVMAGDIYIPVDLQTPVARLQAQRNKSTLSSDESGTNNVGVTRRQREVLKLVAQGHSNKDVALVLSLTEHTVKSHMSALFRLLHAKSRSECVQNAYKIGLIKLPQTNDSNNETGN